MVGAFGHLPGCPQYRVGDTPAPPSPGPPMSASRIAKTAIRLADEKRGHLFETSAVTGLS
jgi:hypothetical protein